MRSKTLFRSIAYGLFLVIGICILVATSPNAAADVAGGPKHFIGTLEPQTFDAFTVDFIDGKHAKFKAVFDPFVLGGIDNKLCEACCVMKVYDGNDKWLATIPAQAKNVNETGVDRTLCVSEAWFTVTKKSLRRQTARLDSYLVNTNVFFSLYAD